MVTAIDMIGTNVGSGTKTYNLNFCENLYKLNIENIIYIFITRDYQKNIKENNNSNIRYIVKSNLLKNIFFRILWMQLILPFELKSLKVNQLFSPMNMGPISLKLFNIKFTLALHSNLPWVYFSKMPGNILRNFLTRILMEISIRLCDRLIVDSEFAKNEIIKLLKIEEKKVYFVYLGIDQKYLIEKDNNFYLDNFEYKNYIISVLSCVRYHNIINLLKGFKLLKKEKNINLKYVFALQILDKKYFDEIKSFVTMNFEKNEIIFLHNLDSKFLVNLYKNSKFYIFSSYCEVFGLTSLEAMSQACPVIISNRSALAEINSDAAEYFNPDDEVEIKNSMYKILSEENYRNKIIEKGKIHYKKFNWKKTVLNTLRILDY
jgi:glycosyltransferase involved in cell wall biosynthesis